MAFFLLCSIAFATRRETKRKRGVKSKILNGLAIFVQFILLILLTTPMIFKPNSKKASEYFELEFPFKTGRYYVSSFHQKVDERYAFDIVQLDSFGRENAFRSNSQNELNKYYIFLDTIFSPVDAVVLKVRSKQIDHVVGELHDYKKLAANYIVLRHQGFIVELLHLAQNSTFVSAGDSVYVGDPIGLVGNSGKSRTPHLHLNVYAENYNLVPISIPIKFNHMKKINKHGVVSL